MYIFNNSSKSIDLDIFLKIIAAAFDPYNNEIV
jgi:hypothetical protein